MTRRQAQQQAFDELTSAREDLEQAIDELFDWRTSLGFRDMAEVEDHCVKLRDAWSRIGKAQDALVESSL